MSEPSILMCHRINVSLQKACDSLFKDNFTNVVSNHLIVIKNKGFILKEENKKFEELLPIMCSRKQNTNY